jgi:methionyl-tRNA synthetase
LEDGLQPRAITRDLDWGVPIPEPGYEGKCIYVWFEAVTGYLSATKEWAVNGGEPEAWQKWWREDDCLQYYFLGKDNIPFHSIIWPAILMARGDTILPYDVVGNQYLNFGTEKFSKSRGVGVSVPELLDEFDPDTLRYYLTAIAPERADSTFTIEDLIARNNNELVGTWGNLIHRTLSLISRSFDGVVPQYSPNSEVTNKVSESFENITKSLEVVHLRDALRDCMALARFGNQFFDNNAPWKQVAEDRAAAADTFGALLLIINTLKITFSPFLPFSSVRLHEALGFKTNLTSEGWEIHPVPVGQNIPEPKHLFKKIEI